MIRVESDLSDDKILFYAPRGLAALLRGNRENKSLRENRRLKMFAVAGYHAVVCDAFIVEREYMHNITTAFDKINFWKTV